MRYVTCVIEQASVAVMLWEVLGLNLSWNVIILTEVFMVSFSLQANSVIVLLLGYDHSFQNTSSFVCYPTICHCIVCDTESTMK